jgi:hypothetical protein
VVLSQMSWWERFAVAVIAGAAIVTAAMMFRASVLSAALLGLVPLTGLGLIYQDKSTTPARRGAMLGWLAFVEAALVHLSGV